MSLQSPSVTIIVPHFKRIKSHWVTLRSVLEQDYDSFNLIIGCDPGVSDSVIKYINEYRFSIENNCLYSVRLFDNIEGLTETEYYSFLEANTDTEQSIILDVGMKFKHPDILSTSMSTASGEQVILQDIISLNLIPCSGFSFFSFSEPLPEEIKRKVLWIRDTFYKQSRLENFLNNLIWFVFFLTTTEFLRNQGNQQLRILVFFSTICFYSAFILLGVRLFERVVVLLYDKLVIWRRRRRGGK